MVDIPKDYDFHMYFNTLNFYTTCFVVFNATLLLMMQCIFGLIINDMKIKNIYILISFEQKVLLYVISMQEFSYVQTMNRNQFISAHV